MAAVILTGLAACDSSYRLITSYVALMLIGLIRFRSKRIINVGLGEMKCASRVCMTRHERHDSVDEILNDYFPFRGSPVPDLGPNNILEAGQSRRVYIGYFRVSQIRLSCRGEKIQPYSRLHAGHSLRHLCSPTKTTETQLEPTMNILGS